MEVKKGQIFNLMDKSSRYDEMILKVHDLFEVDKTSFDMDWREKFMDEVRKANRDNSTP